MFIVVALASTAGAQVWSEEASGVLVAEAGTITANGVGSPSVVWDPVAARYVMFFETRTGAAGGDCAGGTWSIGVASSDDGLSWDVWPDAVVSPTAGTPWRCVAAHPTAVYDDGTYHLWFKAEQGNNACSAANGGNKAWGCNNYAGIAHAVVDVDLDDKSAEIDAVEAEIEALEASPPPADALATALADYEADLLARGSEFACAKPSAPGICAPCGSFRVRALEGGSDTQPLCQPLSFTIPSTVSVTNNSSGHVVTLSFTTTAGANVRCEYRKNGGTYVLDSDPSGARVARCLAPDANLVAGSTVTTSSGVTIAIDEGNASPAAWVDLTATNLASQTYSGELFGTIDALQDDLAAGDGDVDASALVDDLGALLAWYAPFTPADPEKTALETDGQALVDLAVQLDDDVDAWNAQLDALDAELADLLAYEPNVDVVQLLNQVGLPIARTFGYPAAMKKGSTWVLMFQDYPNVWRATSASPDGPFVVDATPAMSAGTVSWASTEVYEPNLMCSGDPVFKYQTYFGGRTVTGGVFTTGGISDGVSLDTASWLLNTMAQYFGWTDVNDFRHFDVLRASDGQYRMWYTERVNGLVQVNLASTSAAYVSARSTQRVCP